MRPCLTISLLGVCLAVLSSASVDANEGLKREQPNVLFIAVDDLASALGCYGDPTARTPNIDRLASMGTCFQHAYNQLPLCNPTRASVMTGLRPDTIKVYDLDRHFRDELPDVVTLSQSFQRAGYFAARVGKIFHYNVPASIGTDGFDDPASWNRTVNPRGRDKDDEALVFNAEPHRKISGALSWLAADGSDEEQTDGMIATEAIKIMREKRGEPFFLGVGFFRPHTPYVAPKEYFEWYPLESLRLPDAPSDDRDDIPTAAFAHNCPMPNYGLDQDTLLRATQAYYACVSFVDAQVGRLLDALTSLELENKTIVVFWSDHGYHLGEHGGIWQKRTLFEQASRAPLIIRVPGQSARGNCQRIVEFVDIYPTLTDLAKIESPPDLAGRSLRPLINDSAARWDRDAVTQILRPADDRLPEPVMGCSIRTERYRYTEWANGKYGVELYDHQNDPNEFDNLAFDPDSRAREVIEELRPRLRAKASGDIPSVPVNPARL
ncbi:putative sulfatase [Rhodopirellula rubra]|uniref:Putative sulfatase n=1 Tax=Aporhodopirellula rubra TaxID=980271 RepID=A0A7W5DWK8_9BACT|nr:sulfatase [Aporhodopirellula rubra]MBB3205760.1 putative sulfatase [Aporhodopirellula rubra]